jgi:hypothetical protein
VESSYTNFRGKNYQVYYPVQQWFGPDQRGLPFKSYVMRCQDDAEYRKGTSSAFVWANGDWKPRRVSLGWSDFKNIKDVVGRLPRSFYPCVERDLLVQKNLLTITPRNIRLVKEVVPAGSLSRVGLAELVRYDFIGNGGWSWEYMGRVEGGNIINRWQKLTDEELYSNEALLLAIMEANLSL